MRHLILPDIDIEPGFLIAEYEAYLHEWLLAAREDAESGHVSAAICLQGAFAELATTGRLETDWLGIFDAYLTDELGGPLAYSEAYGTRLYKFAAQWKQSTVHAIHTRWWLECAIDRENTDHSHFAQLLAPKESAGWICDHDVSPTIERHRMKSELTQSIEIDSYPPEFTVRALLEPTCHGSVVVGPIILTPKPPTFAGTPASANSSFRMNWSSVPISAPPYFVGHAGAIHFFGASFFRNARPNSCSSSSIALSAPSQSAGNASLRKSRTSARNDSCSSVNLNLIAGLLEVGR